MKLDHVVPPGALHPPSKAVMRLLREANDVFVAFSQTTFKMLIIIRKRFLMLTIFLLWNVASLLAGQKLIDQKELTNLLGKGVLLLEQKKYSEARHEFRSLTQKDPSFAQGFFYLGIAEMNTGDLLAAEGSFRRALNLDPHATNTLYNLGIVLLEEGKPDEAIPRLEKVWKAANKNPCVSSKLREAADSSN